MSWVFSVRRLARVSSLWGALGLLVVLIVPAAAQTSGYRTEVAFTGITFNQPLGFATPPGETNRIFVLEKPGRIQVITNLAGTPAKQLFLDLTDRVVADGEGGVLGLAFHPNFATNRYFYVFYTTTATTTAGTGLHDRVSRFTALAAPASNADILATERPLISQYDEASNHNGGDLHFGPDGYLYVALGDEGGGNDQYGNGQRIDRDFFAAILRLDVDALPANLIPNPHPAVHIGAYRVPADNPFVGATSFNGAAVTTAAVRSEIWAIGLRNPWRFSFDPSTGRLFAGDVGQGAREEIDLITKGGNYGWSYREGLVAGPRANPPAAASFIDPIWDADRATAGSITGGVVYRGSRFPALVGRYIFGDYVRDRIFAMTIPSTGAVTVETLLTEDSPVAFGTDPRNGDILIASIGTGAIRRLIAPEAPASVAITAQPVAQVVAAGRAVSFSAAGTGGNGRWQVSTDAGTLWSDVVNGGNYSGAATGTLTVMGATTGMSGNRYRYVVTGPGGSAASTAVMLTVMPLIFPAPAALAFDAAGNFYVSDSTDNVIRKVESFASASLFGGSPGQAGTADGQVDVARFNQPGGVVVSGSIYVADTANATIRRITTAYAVTTLAGSTTLRGNNDGTGAAATFSSPLGMAADGSGNLYVADAANHTIRRVTNAGAVTTVAGGPGISGTADGAAGAARFNRPGGVARDTAGNLYVSDTVNNTIRRIAADGTVSTFAGVAGVSGSTDGTGAAALFNEPTGMAVDAAGNVFVADTSNNAIRRITPAGAVTTLAGLPTVAGQQDGTGTSGWFNHPRGVAVDASGNVYVADTGNAAIRRVTPTGVVTTLALMAGLTPLPSPDPPSQPNPPTPVPPNPPAPPSGGGGGGGGAVSPWFLAALASLVALRRRSGRR